MGVYKLVIAISRNLWPAPLAPLAALLQALVEQRVEMNKRCLEKLKASHPQKINLSVR